MSLTISVRSAASRRPILSDFEVPPPDGLRDDGSLTLRDVIDHVVRHQVRAFRRRQIAMRFDRVLSAAQIERDAARGKVDPAGKDHSQEVDEDEAVAAALTAFEDGLYLIIIDEVERRTLDEPVYLASSSRMIFVRLTFLSGV